MDSAESTSCRSRVEIETEEQRDKCLQRRRERERECRAPESEEMREDRSSKRRAGTELGVLRKVQRCERNDCRSGELGTAQGVLL